MIKNKNALGIINVGAIDKFMINSDKEESYQKQYYY